MGGDDATEEYWGNSGLGIEKAEAALATPWSGVIVLPLRDTAGYVLLD